MTAAIFVTATALADSPDAMTRRSASSEVKATTSDGRAPFPITFNEWRLAQECHDDGEERVYVIVRVRQIQEAPEIFDVIVDPVKALQDGWLRMRDKDLYLVVGHAVDQAPKVPK